MAIELSATASALKESTQLEVQTVIRFEGISTVFGAVTVEETVKIGDELVIGEFTIGGLQEIKDSKPYVIPKGTTSNISGQVNIEEGLPNSISRFQVNIVDKNGEVSKIFQRGNVVPDLLGVAAEVFVGFVGGSFPDDFVRVFIGVVDQTQYTPNTVKVSLSAPEKLRQNEVFVKAQTTLTSPISDSDTTIPVSSTARFIAPEDVLQSYIRIDDELMEVFSLTASSFTVSRGQLDTFNVPHASGTDVESYYRLQGSPIDLALKILIGGATEEFIQENIAVGAYNQLSPGDFVQNAIYFPEIADIEDELGLVEGDLITITGSDDPSNDLTAEPIVAFGKSAPGSYVTVNATLTTALNQSAIAKIKSKYNTLPAKAGFGIAPKFIDLKQFELIKAQQAASLLDNDIYIKDTVEGEDFISSKLLYPNGVFSTVRKGRTSGVYISPPVVTNQAPILNIDNIVNPQNITIQRSINTNFYSVIQFKFNEDAIEDKFKAVETVVSAESLNEIKVPEKVLTIEAPGLRDTPAVREFLNNQAIRLLQRFRYGAEEIKLQAHFRDTFFLDLRDNIVLNGDNLFMHNSKDGTRDFKTRVMSIKSRDFNIFTGEIRLTLLDTIFATDARYAVYAPASRIGAGATTSQLPLKKSYGTTALEEEFEKWLRLIGERVRVRSQDYTFDEESVFVGFATTNSSRMLLDPPLPSAPGEDYIVEPAAYDETDARVNNITKAIHPSYNKTNFVLSGISSTQFTVATLTNMKEGQRIRVHNPDFSNDSGDIEITDVTGTTVTVEDMGFTPSAGDLVDRITYNDLGDPYVYL